MRCLKQRAELSILQNYLACATVAPTPRRLRTLGRANLSAVPVPCFHTRRLPCTFSPPSMCTSNSVPTFLFGCTPPRDGTEEDKAMQSCSKFSARSAALATDGFIVYDIQDEAGRTSIARPFPFRKTLDPSWYGSLFPTQSGKQTVVYKCVVEVSGGGGVEPLRASVFVSVAWRLFLRFASYVSLWCSAPPSLRSSLAPNPPHPTLRAPSTASRSGSPRPLPPSTTTPSFSSAPPPLPASTRAAP